MAELEHGKTSTPAADLWEQGKKRYLAGDHPGAARFILKAAEAGNPDAQNQIGYMYEAGDGVKKSDAEAGKWYQAGAAQGHARCEFALGSLYEAGRGVKENWDEAARWYQRSAMQDNEYGMYALGRAYQYGIGVPLDLNTAITWYDKAAANGSDKAAFAAKYLRDNHGMDGSSRTPEEQAMLGPLVQRMVLTAPPLGHTFHSSVERLAYIRAVAQDESLRKAQMFWNMKKADYDTCRQTGRDNCHPPGPPPK